jgi:hypothetical protein
VLSVLQTTAYIPMKNKILKKLTALCSVANAFGGTDLVLKASTADVAVGAAVVAGGVGLVVLVLDDATVVGILDDIAIAPLAALFGWGVSALVK